jgi:hypothetical protein
MLEHGPPSSGTARKRAGISLIVVGGLLYGAAGGVDGDYPSVFVGPLVMLGGIVLHFRGRQQAAKSIAESSTSPLRDSKADVLYLRSFRTDASSRIKILASGLSTEEEQLADVLRPFGDLIAIGQPGEPLPMPGAARMYATDAEWKSVVLDRMRSAPLVVIRAGTGPGLFWEVGQALSTLSPEKVLILILNLTMKEYCAFADQMRDSFQVALPTIGRCGLLRTVVDYRDNPSKVLPGFVRFAGDWQPVFLPLPFTMVRLGYNDLKKSFNVALRPVFEARGVAWHPARRFGSGNAA